DGHPQRTQPAKRVAECNSQRGDKQAARTDAEQDSRPLLFRLIGRVDELSFRRPHGEALNRQTVPLQCGDLPPDEAVADVRVLVDQVRDFHDGFSRAESGACLYSMRVFGCARSRRRWYRSWPTTWANLPSTQNKAYCSAGRR